MIRCVIIWIFLADIDECNSDPCVNGNCTDDVNMYTCECFDGYDGDQCESNTTNTAKQRISIYE